MISVTDISEGFRHRIVFNYIKKEHNRRISYFSAKIKRACVSCSAGKKHEKTCVFCPLFDKQRMCFRKPSKENRENTCVVQICFLRLYSVPRSETRMCFVT